MWSRRMDAGLKDRRSEGYKYYIVTSVLVAVVTDVATNI